MSTKKNLKIERNGFTLLLTDTVIKGITTPCLPKYFDITELIFFFSASYIKKMLRASINRKLAHLFIKANYDVEKFSKLVLKQSLIKSSDDLNKCLIDAVNVGNFELAERFANEKIKSRRKTTQEGTR